ncbi:MAG: ParB/RepB/Spo0J family partition protein [Bacilli bacterium]
MEQTKRKALGKGLEQLFSNETFNLDEFERNIVESSNKEDVIQVLLSELRNNPYQPRQVFDEDKLSELAESIKTYGVIEPIIIKKSIKGYEIVAGERRVLASKKAGLDKIPAIIRDFTDDEMMEIALLENIQRENLNIMEEADAYKNIIEKLGLTQEEMAKKIGKSRSYVTNALGLLKLPRSVRALVLEGTISMGHARVLSKLEDEDKIIELSNSIVKNATSVRDLEELVNNPLYIRKSPNKKEVKDNKYDYVETIMREKIGTRVKINSKNITIPYDSEKDLERILEILNISINME